MLYVPGIPPVYRTMFTVPNIAIMNIMACRVFRNTRFGVIRNTEILSTLKVSGTTNGASASVMVNSRSDFELESRHSSEGDRNKSRVTPPYTWGEVTV